MTVHPLKAYRERQGLSVRAVGAAVDASIATISRIERGRQRPSIVLLRRLVDTTRLPADAFVYYDPEGG